MRRLILVSFVVAACSGSTSTPLRPPSPHPAAALASPAPAMPAPAPAPPPASQRFAPAGPGFAFADPDRARKLAAALSAIDAAVAREMKQQNLPGLALGVVIDGQLVYAKGYGVANLEAKTPPDADTVYRIGSLTKSFTALAILMLRDDGVLGLDDPLAKWIPEAGGLSYPTKDAPPITLRQLLTHTSGLPTDLPAGGGAADAPSEAALLKRLDGLALERVPGTAWSYSNLGFSLLGIVVGHASHSSLHEVIDQRILAPLGMTSTVWHRAQVPAGRLARSYDVAPNGPIPWTHLEHLGAGDGAGGIYSTARDMARYIALQLSAYPPSDAPDRGIVRRATLREAHSTGVFVGASVYARRDAKPGQPSVVLSAGAYGFGWEHFRTCEYDDFVAHAGGIEGYHSEVHFLTAHGVGVVALSNFVHGKPGLAIDRVIEELAKTGALEPYVAHVQASPLFATAMTSLLAVYNTWDEAGFRALLARPPVPGEANELAGYRRLHGACSGFTPAAVTSPLSAHFAMECEHGVFDLEVDLTPTGLIRGFSGRSRHVAVPPEVANAAADALSLIGRWNERVFARSFAQPTPTLDKYRHLYESIRGKGRTCKLEEIWHEIQWWKLRATCDHGGDLVVNMTMAATKIADLRVDHSSESACPLE